MNQQDRPINKIVEELQERAKELNCLYRIEELLNTPTPNMKDLIPRLIKIIPNGWQYPEICQIKIDFDDDIYLSENFIEAPWVMCAPITVQDTKLGTICVYYSESRSTEDEGPFLKEERRLVNTIAERLGYAFFFMKQRQIFKEWELTQKKILEKKAAEWQAILDLLKRTDQNLYTQISRKMINQLCWSGSVKAQELMEEIAETSELADEEVYGEVNRPSERKPIHNFLFWSDQIFTLASEHFSDREILTAIQKWIQEDKSNLLVKTIENQTAPLMEIVDILRKYLHMLPELSPQAKTGLRVSLIRRFFFDNLTFINIAKHYVRVSDFHELVQKIIYPTGSLGKLGGKSAGLFLAHKILQKASDQQELFKHVKVPKTYYIASDGHVAFIHYNNLEDVIEQKYKEIDQIRMEYPQIIQLFKNSYFPPEIVRGLSMALDDFGDSPLIVRSSSLLEDNLGTAFSGKYKSLFLANQGSKEDRLEALTDAIAEVYASTFSPDPIQYRAERGLLDFHEEMGILIQEVVGTKIGKFYLPAYAGVAFSNNEFRWSPRIQRQDGLIRLVPGLGTRAVDRLSDEYPILLAPGQPNLRVNITADEVLRYSPNKLDVINLETNSFETVPLEDLMKEAGEKIPNIRHIVSVYKDNHIRRASGLMDFDKEHMVVTFEGLIRDTEFMKMMHAILLELQDKLHMPVDIEFASDGRQFYLLQCRPQCYTEGNVPSPIPQDIPDSEIVFTANKYISNGKMPDITHVVYVDPERYNLLSDMTELNTVGRIIGRLNKILPKKQFVLMGPGRWGSRGDIKLGVKVTYSDFSNTAMLIEIAKQKGNYVPELSFGTHFFQDLVESSIRYLPLYPDEKDVKFNERFLSRAPNILSEILPDFKDLEDTVRIIDVPNATGGKILRVLMNADIDQAVGFLSDPAQPVASVTQRSIAFASQSEDHWRWRMRMAEKIAAELDPDRFGVKALYLFGSVKNATAGPGSDIDLLVHFSGSRDQRNDLTNWLEGWSLCLGEMNYLRTGYKSDGLLDFHLVTDEDIENRTSFAVKIGAITDPARELALTKNTSD